MIWVGNRIEEGLLMTAAAGNAPAYVQVSYSHCLWLQVLRLVYELKQAGHFTAVALTRPFEFEGRRKAEAAETLISALEEAAHFVTVIEQARLQLTKSVCY